MGEFAACANVPFEEHWESAGLTLRHEDNLRGLTGRRVLTNWRERHKTEAWRAYNTQWQRDNAEERNRRKRERRAAARALKAA